MKYQQIAKFLIAQKLRKAIQRCYLEMPDWYEKSTEMVGVQTLLDKVTWKVEEAIFEMDQKDEDTDMFTVKTILDFAICKDGCRRYPMYLVVWEGFSKPTWEYDYNLNHCDEIDWFWSKVGFRQSSKTTNVYKFFRRAK